MPVQKKSLTQATSAAKPTTKSLKTTAPTSAQAATALRPALRTALKPALRTALKPALRTALKPALRVNAE